MRAYNALASFMTGLVVVTSLIALALVTGGFHDTTFTHGDATRFMVAQSALQFLGMIFMARISNADRYVDEKVKGLVSPTVLTLVSYGAALVLSLMSVSTFDMVLVVYMGFVEHWGVLSHATLLAGIGLSLIVHYAVLWWMVNTTEEPAT